VTLLFYCLQNTGAVRLRKLKINFTNFIIWKFGLHGVFKGIGGSSFGVVFKGKIFFFKEKILISMEKFLR
jgi:hypothetical protein